MKLSKVLCDFVEIEVKKLLDYLDSIDIEYSPQTDLELVKNIQKIASILIKVLRALDSDLKVRVFLCNNYPIIIQI